MSTLYTARFIPIENGTRVALGNTGLPGVSGDHKIIGFKSGPGPQARGWLVVLVAENDETGKPRANAPKRVTRVVAS